MKKEIYLAMIKYHIKNKIFTQCNPTDDVGDVRRTYSPLFEVFGMKTWIVQGKKCYQILYQTDNSWDYGFIKKTTDLQCLSLWDCNFSEKVDNLIDACETYYWNECQYFSYERSVRIMNNFNKMTPNKMYYDAGTDSFCVKYKDGFDEIYKGVDIDTPDGIQHLYPIGNYYWIWEEK